MLPTHTITIGQAAAHDAASTQTTGQPANATNPTKQEKHRLKHHQERNYSSDTILTCGKNR